MRNERKKPKSDLRKYYTIFLEGGLIVVLVIFLVAMKLDFRGQQQNVDLTKEQEVVQMEQIEQTEHEEKPPPPPRPQVPVEVPNDEVVEDQNIDISADLNLQDKLEMPPPPDDSQEEEEEDFFVVVEQMPTLKGGLAKLQGCVNYPEMARKAGIEGRVIVQFIVNEQGNVEEPRVVRGIGGGADKEALRCVKQSEFEPGRQRGNPVRVQYSLPVVFKLQN
ncbi:energy transducer TonB [Aliifodinibius sp. S!AR15-10]|uniref:energy transducer TonB n=1 Tax=Aliifodinibius sp. S!AR15-10 TaxID=2950437 RepID=UPI0028552FA7|nr:energy transducer TonB [Aliifodinibius sp. S!AR15-10]MDR8392078.1 energy transducer TonB [Aliifodinibius sp. S!AR15-10]